MLTSRQRFFLLSLFLLGGLIVYQNKIFSRVEILASPRAEASPIKPLPRVVAGQGGEMKSSSQTAPRTDQSQPPVKAVRARSEKIEDKSIEQIYCWLKEQNIDVPTGGEVRIASGGFLREEVRGEELTETGFYVMVSSTDCPRDHYSIVHHDKRTGKNKVTDCRKTNLAELTLEWSQQWNVIEHPDVDGEVNLGISGVGYFTKYCPGTGYVVTRDGRFHVGDDGILRSQEGCIIWGTESGGFENGGPLMSLPGTSPNSEGCFEDGQCVAVIDPLKHGVENFTAIDSKNLAANIDPSKMEHLQDAKLFTGSYEDLDDPNRGPAGWETTNHWPLLEGTPDCAAIKARGSSNAR